MQQRPVPDALQEAADLPQYAVEGMARPRRALRSKYEAPQSPASVKLMQQAASSWAQAPVGHKGPKHTDPPAKLTEEQNKVRTLLQT